MAAANLHEWNLAPAQAIMLQKELAGKIVASGEVDNVKFVAGADISVPRGSKTARTAIVVLSFPGLEIVECKIETAELSLPYIPGLLSFREAPLILDVYQKLSIKPDLLFVDGQGVAHPRRLGIAAHLGLWLDKPTIGCAKSRLCGEHAALGPEKGSRVSLLDDGEVIGTVLRTRWGANPLYISSGHRIGLENAVHWVLACTLGYRLPEPTRLAHLAAGGHLPVAGKVLSCALP